MLLGELHIPKSISQQKLMQLLTKEQRILWRIGN